MKRLLLLTALLPFVGFAQPIKPGELNPARQQMLPNNNGGMLNGNRNPDSSLNQQHMLQERRNGDMLNPASTSQPDLPLKTIGP